MNKQRIFNCVAALTTLALLLCLTGCLPELPEPQSAAQFPTAAAPPSQVSPLATPAPLSPVSPLPTAAPPTPAPTDDDIMLTPAPTTTPPPFPTPLPTPVVTPIPTVAPPIIPEVVGKAQQPFWIIYWQGNEVWRIDDQGKERQLLLDTYKSLGQWLTDIPDPYKDTDCCWIGPRVVVSPDGQKIALVVVDKINGTKNDRFTFSIYVFDIPTGSLSVLSDGEFPQWSPDGKRIAFRRGNAEKDKGLWIADVETGKVWLLIKDDIISKDVFISNWVWSPDSRQIVYQFNQGYQSVPGIWMIDLDRKSPLLMPETDKLVDRFPMGVHVNDWLPDGQHLLVMAEDPAKGLEHVSSLWILSIKSGELAQLTHDMRVGGGLLSPDGKRLAINASRHYEGERQPADIWLLNLDDRRLLRVTFAPPEDIGGYWSPDGTRLIFLRKDVGLVTLSLDHGKVTALGFDPSFSFAVGGAK